MSDITDEASTIETLWTEVAIRRLMSKRTARRSIATGAFGAGNRHRTLNQVSVATAQSLARLTTTGMPKSGNVRDF